MDQNTGKYLMIIGILVVLAGAVIYFFGDRLGWIGRLPGDIRIETKNTRFYFPLTTLLLFSVLLTIIVNLLKRLF